jgi:hypothetical protein
VIALEDELDALFGGPAASFVAGRNALAKALKAEGRKEEALSVAKLERPTPVAWVVNQLHFGARELLEELRETGRRLKAAQESRAAGEEYAEERNAHRDALRRAADRAVTIGTERGVNVTPDLRRRITMNLELISAAPDVNPAPGRMAVELAPLGFDALSLDAPLAPPSRPTRAEAAEAALEAERLGPVKEALSAAEKEARRLLRDAELADAAVSRATRDVEDAERRLAETRGTLDAARERALAARQSADTAAREVEDARRALEGLSRATERR